MRCSGLFLSLLFLTFALFFSLSSLSFSHNHMPFHPMSYFQRVFTCSETSYAETRDALCRLFRFESGPRGRERAVLRTASVDIDAGWFYAPSVAELRVEVEEAVSAFSRNHPTILEQLRSRPPTQAGKHRLVLSHIEGESNQMHIEFPGALFQAASQFNLLEFISSSVTPEEGIENYIYDRTQGPACALACFPGTAYRNYMIHPRFFPSQGGASTTTSKDAPKTEDRGQQEDRQVNMIDDVAHRLAQAYLGVSSTSSSLHAGVAGHAELPAVPTSSLFTICNGYFLADDTQKAALTRRLDQLQQYLGGSASGLAEHIASALRIGIVEDTAVTATLQSTRKSEEAPLLLHSVTQTYNSALSLPWKMPAKPELSRGIEVLAQAVLQGTYEATLLAGVLHTLRLYERVLATHGDTASLPPLPPIFLTKVGGGVFNNRPEWIKVAITTALEAVSTYNVPMNVRLVHFGRIDPFYQD